MDQRIRIRIHTKISWIRNTALRRGEATVRGGVAGRMDPDPLVRGMDPWIRIRVIHTKISGEVKPLYEAESPDELALIDAAYAYNCKLLKRSPDRLTVSLPGDGQVSVAGAAVISAAGQKNRNIDKSAQIFN